MPGIQNPTRHLAQRDNLLADKVNEVVGVVNNREQFIPLPLPRTLLSPNESVVATNYRIPVGFEARILNAAISATPSTMDIELDIFYSAGTFGGVTGTNIVSTAGEFDGGVSFYQAGEFVVTLKNKSSVVLELAASVMLTLRPLGAAGSLLAASVIAGPGGPPGPTGPPGPSGSPGSGGAGTPGMIWTGSYQVGRVYRDKEVASFNLYGSLISSFIARTTTTEDPQTSYLTNDGVWNPVAIGSAGPVGNAGTAGATGSNSVIPSAFTQFVNGTMYSSSDWVVTPVTGYNSLLTDAVGGTTATSGAHTYVFGLRETYIESTSNNPSFQRGLSTLVGALRFAFTGGGTIQLPSIALSASKLNYNSTNCDVMVSVQGTVPVYVNGSGTFAGGVTCYPVVGTNSQFVVRSANPSTVWVELGFHGGAAY